MLLVFSPVLLVFSPVLLELLLVQRSGSAVGVLDFASFVVGGPAAGPVG